MEFERPGKVIPRLVMRPFVQGSSYHELHWFDNRFYVIAFTSLFELVTVGFFLVGFFGFAWFVVGSVAKNINDCHVGVIFFFIGGAGGILTFKLEKIRRFVVFDREKSELIKSDCKPNKNGEPRPMKVLSFHECEPRLMSIHGGLGTSHQFDIGLFHASQKMGSIHSARFGYRVTALGYWAFLVQYMDKQAPLPDVDGLWPYPNRTSGLGSLEQWETFEKQPGFIDPLDVYWGHWQFDPPEDARKVYELYEPRKMRADIAPVNGPHDASLHIETQAKTTFLPKKLLRPFYTAGMSNISDKFFVIKGFNFYDRFHYLAAWTLMCAGLALFAVSSIAALPLLAAGTAYLIYFRRQRRSKGTVFDRQNGQVILHHGLHLTPVVLDFDQCEGRLVRTDHREGFCRYQLQLQHPCRSPVNLSTRACVSLEYLLGFWSFLVQYMDKDAPLPDVKGLEDYPGKDQGLGPWKTWAEKTVRQDFVDPFAQWLKELEIKKKQEITRDQKSSSRSRPTVQTATNPTGQTG